MPCSRRTSPGSSPTTWVLLSIYRSRRTSSGPSGLTLPWRITSIGRSGRWVSQREGTRKAPCKVLVIQVLRVSCTTNYSERPYCRVRNSTYFIWPSDLYWQIRIYLAPLEREKAQTLKQRTEWFPHRDDELGVGTWCGHGRASLSNQATAIEEEHLPRVE